MAKGQALTFRQRKFLFYFLVNDDTKFNGVASVKAAGYKFSTEQNHNKYACQLKKRLKPFIQQYFDQDELDESGLKQRLVEGINAMETKFFAHQGNVVETKEVIAWLTRYKYLELAMKYKGLLTEKVEIVGAGTLANEIKKARKRTDDRDSLPSRRGADAPEGSG